MSPKESTVDTDEAPAKGGRKKLILILVVVLLAAGGAAYFFLFSGSGSAKAAAPVPGVVTVLDPVTVNLAGGGYLKIGVALQLTDAVGSEASKIDGSKAKDLIISTFSQAQPADVIGAREALKKALEKKIEKAYDGEVMGIYYTDYVTQ